MDGTTGYGKFQHSDFTAKGEERASVYLSSLKTLWFNTGSLCNITCKGCYMDSSPKNDRLVYISASEVQSFLDEIGTANLEVEEIGLTGGEPFMNPEIIPILESALTAGHDVLVLTNAMKPMSHKKEALLTLKERYGEKLGLRVSIDHYEQKHHEELRGPESWQPMINGVHWLVHNGFRLAVAGRTLWGETEHTARENYARMFERENIPLDAFDEQELVLFPEMDETVDVPEITTACWGILEVQPDAMMCATSRMVVKRKGEDAPVVVPCTLLPYDTRFDMGVSLREAEKIVKLNHPHCAKFCVLGGGSCSKS
jgi:MoaA/NifB/PqqE/SkfB family radical SAM enzyme